MPYFKWSGITINGTLMSGKQCASSVTHLDTILIQQHIALLSAKKIYTLATFLPVPTNIIVETYKQITLCIDAGILLPQTIAIVTQQARNITMQETLLSIGQQLDAGTSLSNAGKPYPFFMSPMTTHLINVAEESGNLSKALHIITSYLENKRTFNHRLKSSIIMPAITFTFFLIITAIIFFFIIPQFETLFHSLGKQLPPLTRALIITSRWCIAHTIIIFMAPITLISGVIMGYQCNLMIRNTINRLWCTLPLIGTIIHYRILSNWLASITMMLDGGIPLVTALHIAQQGINIEHIRIQYLTIAQATESGQSLADSVRNYGPSSIDQEIIALIYMAQETGNMSTLLSTSHALIQAKIERLLTFITILTQPVMLCAIAILVLGLIIAIYEPIILMSKTIN